jgi:hypothetical protein
MLCYRRLRIEGNGFFTRTRSPTVALRRPDCPDALVNETRGHGALFYLAFAFDEFFGQLFNLLLVLAEQFIERMLVNLEYT